MHLWRITLIITLKSLHAIYFVHLTTHTLLSDSEGADAHPVCCNKIMVLNARVGTQKELKCVFSFFSMNNTHKNTFFLCVCSMQLHI